MELDEYFMELARKTAEESKELSTKVGCVIVNENNDIVSIGCNNYVIDPTLEGIDNKISMRHLISVHAEMKALISASKPIKNCKIYVTHAPCENCLKHLITAGIKEIIYEQLSTKTGFITQEGRDAIIRMMKETNIKNRNMKGISYINDK
ncbi:MAG TPA: deaminase [Rickettsiales bacterium]|nr:deaminase [Rickettsiales bacterium]